MSTSTVFATGGIALIIAAVYTMLAEASYTLAVYALLITGSIVTGTAVAISIAKFVRSSQRRRGQAQHTATA